MNVQDCILQSFIFSILISFLLSWQVVCEEGDSYAYSKYGRFCHEIKMNYSPYVNYFTRVYWNRSYFVYRINTVISFQSWKSMQASFWGLTVVEFSWKNSFWLRKLFLQIHVGAVYWPGFWVLFFFHQTGTVRTLQTNCYRYLLWRNQETLTILLSLQESVAVFHVLAFVFPL